MMGQRPRKVNLTVLILSMLLVVATVFLVFLILNKNTTQQENDTTKYQYQEDVNSYIYDSNTEIDIETTKNQLVSYINDEQRTPDDKNYASRSLAKIYIQEGKYEEAAQVLEQTLYPGISDQNRVLTLTRLSDIYDKTGNIDKEKETIQILLAMSDNVELEYESMQTLKEIYQEKLNQIERGANVYK